MTTNQEKVATEILVRSISRLCADNPSWMVLIAVGEVLGRVLASSKDDKLVEETLEHFCQSVREVRKALL